MKTILKALLCINLLYIGFVNASVCDNSAVIIKNNTKEVLVIGNVTTRQPFYKYENHLGEVSVQSGAKINPGSELKFFANSGSGSHGDVSVFFTVSGDHGNSEFSVYFGAEGLFSQQCMVYENSVCGNQKYYKLTQEKANGSPGKIVYTIGTS